MRKTENVKNEGRLVPRLPNGLVDWKKIRLDGAAFWTVWALAGLRVGALVVPQSSARLTAFSCVSAESGAIVKKADPLIGREFDSSVNLGEQGPRRLAVSVGFVENDGLPGRRFSLLMGAPCGKPSGLPFPMLRSANPHGVARPFSSECVTSPKNNIGVRTMCANSSRPAAMPADTLSPISADKVFAYLLSDDSGLSKAESEAVSMALRSLVSEALSALNAREDGRPATMVLRLSDVVPLRTALGGLRALIAVRDRAAVRAHLFS